MTDLLRSDDTIVQLGDYIVDTDGDRHKFLSALPGYVTTMYNGTIETLAVSNFVGVKTSDNESSLDIIGKLIRAGDRTEFGTVREVVRQNEWHTYVRFNSGTTKRIGSYEHFVVSRAIPANEESMSISP